MMKELEKLDWKKMNGLIPVIIQDVDCLQVLMLGYMNHVALEKTIQEGMVTFYSRSKERLWTKGEQSGNFLVYKKMYIDCDNDSILILAKPKGPTCHNGTNSCFTQNKTYSKLAFLNQLWDVIEQRYQERPENSYTSELFHAGLDRIAQKLGEEAVETVIAAKNNDMAAFLNEASDLIYHLLVLLRIKNADPSNLFEILEKRHSSSVHSLNS